MKVLLDTNIYFRLLHEGKELERWAPTLVAIGPRLYLSSVVRFEMLQGARGELGRARVRRATRTLEQVGRVVAPSPADWDRAGDIQGRIWDEHAGQRQRSLQNDILIACSARAIGALVITDNAKDFTVIGRYVSHQATDLEGLARRLAR